MITHITQRNYYACGANICIICLDCALGNRGNVTYDKCCNSIDIQLS